MHSGAVEFSAADFDATAASNGSGPANNFGTVIEFDDNFIYGGATSDFFIHIAIP